jgi:glyoxylase-like metal-dependent hydrolase (beta-lactamase superfamily II)
MIEQLELGPIQTNCWIYAPDDGACTVIDPGAEPEAIIARLRALSLKPEYLLLTHGHFDHTGGLAALAAAYPEAVIAIHREDAPYLGAKAQAALDRDLRYIGISPDMAGINGQPLPDPGRLLEEGDSIGPFQVLHLPGHSPGSAGFLDSKHKVLFSGDTLFRGSYGRTDLPGGNAGALFQSLDRLLSLDPEFTVYPGHGHITSIAQERLNFT